MAMSSLAVKLRGGRVSVSMGSSSTVRRSSGDGTAEGAPGFQLGQSLRIRERFLFADTAMPPPKPIA